MPFCTLLVSTGLKFIAEIEIKAHMLQWFIFQHCLLFFFRKIKFHKQNSKSSNTFVFWSPLFRWCFILVKCFVLRSWECLGAGIYFFYSVFCLCWGVLAGETLKLSENHNDPISVHYSFNWPMRSLDYGGTRYLLFCVMESWYALSPPQHWTLNVKTVM